jgi:hypothetical protein
VMMARGKRFPRRLKWRPIKVWYGLWPPTDRDDGARPPLPRSSSRTWSPVPRLGIGEFHTGTEALHGVASLGIVAMFPQAIGLATVWDRRWPSRSARPPGARHADSTPATRRPTASTCGAVRRSPCQRSATSPRRRKHGRFGGFVHPQRKSRAARPNRKRSTGTHTLPLTP